LLRRRVALARDPRAVFLDDDRGRRAALRVAGAAEERPAPAAADDHLLAAELARRLELGHELLLPLVLDLARDVALRVGGAGEEAPAPTGADHHRRAALGAGLVGLLGDLGLALLVDGHGLLAAVDVVAGAAEEA